MLPLNSHFWVRIHQCSISVQAFVYTVPGGLDPLVTENVADCLICADMHMLISPDDGAPTGKLATVDKVSLHSGNVNVGTFFSFGIFECFDFYGESINHISW